MDKSNESIFKGIINDFQSFLKYLASLWGLLSIFSAFFPLINNFFPLIPLPSLRPDICVLLSTLGSVFVVFFQFTNRKETAKIDVRESGFAYVAAITLIYLVLPNFPDIPFEIYGNWYMSMPWIKFLVNFIILIWFLIEPALYILIFYLFTKLFSVLAVKEWQTRENETRAI